LQFEYCNIEIATGGETSIHILDITSCSICLETLKDPKVLPYIHKFCLQCLDTYCEAKQQAELACPLCRKIFILPSGGVLSLPNNIFISKLLQVHKSTVTTGAKESDKESLCELCSGAEGELTATSYCIECDQHICDRCAGAHQRLKLFKSHQVVRDAEIPSSEKKIKLAVSYCGQHPAEQTRFYCYDCKVVTCHQCFVDKHRAHK